MKKSVYKIHFQGGVYSSELYNEYGIAITRKKEAILYSKNKYPNDSWEVYNGITSYQYKWKKS